MTKIETFDLWSMSDETSPNVDLHKVLRSLIYTEQKLDEEPFKNISNQLVA